jgi:TatD DNase family protein
MNFPKLSDYIDIHTHQATPSEGVFIIENLMSHEGRLPQDNSGVAYCYGIHPWFLNENNFDEQLQNVLDVSQSFSLFAIGEAGFDKIRGPSIELQKGAFEKQIVISEELKKPLIIHCVRAWEELLESHKKHRAKMPWLIHGFRGNVKLADQLLAKGMYLSFWYDFVIRQSSSDLLKKLPVDRIFLETDGAGIDIREIYRKVATDLDLSVEELKSIILSNFNELIRE